MPGTPAAAAAAGAAAARPAVAAGIQVSHNGGARQLRQLRGSFEAMTLGPWDPGTLGRVITRVVPPHKIPSYRGGKQIVGENKKHEDER